MQTMGEHERKGRDDVYPAQVIEARCRDFLNGKKEGMGAVIAEHFGRSISFFQEGDPPGDACRRDLCAIPDGEEAEVISQATAILQKYIKDRWGTSQAFELWVREALPREHAEVTHINEILHFTVLDDDIELHVYPNTTSSPLALLPRLRSGFQAIAQQLHDNQSLEGIKRITGKSPLVPKFAHILERMGFVVERAEDGAVVLDAGGCGKCAMSREEFIKRFL